MNSWRWSLCLLLATLGVTSYGAELSSSKAELMGRVEDFFLHNFHDVTARKSIDWGDVVTLTNGNRSIRYQYEAHIWDKDVFIANQVFTFDKEGKIVGYDNVSGFPKKKEAKAVDTTTKKGMMALVEDFFQNNFRDVTSRQTLEWGELDKATNGNVSIRYKYKATIWDKDTKIINQVFTFDPKGTFVSVKEATN